jgi:hypothetical protein
MHAYPGTHPGETHFWTFCGLYVETGILNIEREASEEEICLTCLAALRREHAGDIEEVE